MIIVVRRVLQVEADVLGYGMIDEEAMEQTTFIYIAARH
jgi:hypothetical protein